MDERVGGASERMTDASNALRSLPSVDAMLGDPDFQAQTAGVPRLVARRAVRQVLDTERTRLRGSRAPEPRSRSELASAAAARARVLGRTSLVPVVNATGVVVHTNLGRSLLSESAIAAVVDAARSYTTLEYDLATGRRGSRLAVAQELLCELTGAEAALVVNNCAGAVLLILSVLAAGRQVVVSRGELVEIGGSFRIPEIMARSGAELVEVGTTNKTHALDYAAAIGPDTALLFKAHRSNFAIEGFTSEVELPELVGLGTEHQVPVVMDLGSGALADLAAAGLPREPTVQATIQTGVGLVAFSGDKLLGGPQAGVIVGQHALVARLAGDPLARALRLDKLSLAALESTLLTYLEPETALDRLPTVAALTAAPKALSESASALAEALAATQSSWHFEVVETRSLVGGGAQPAAHVPSFACAVSPPAEWGTVAALVEGLRMGQPPVVGRVEGGRLLLDVRTLVRGDSDRVVRAFASQGGPKGSR